MKTTAKKATYLLIALSALALSHVAHAVVVYDNSTGFVPTNNFLNPGTHEVGDQIILGGTARALTNFTFQYSTFNLTHSFQAEFRFRLNDGPLVSGTPRPNTTLFDSGLFTLPPAPTALSVTFDTDFGPNGLVVPSNFTWSLQFFGLLPGEMAGPDLFAPVTVGSNFPDYWDFDGTSWTLRANTNNTPPINFAARAEAKAVPDSSGISTIVLSMMGVLGFGLKSRKRK